jgi:hypothetical protein
VRPTPLPNLDQTDELNAMWRSCSSNALARIQKHARNVPGSLPCRSGAEAQSPFVLRRHRDQSVEAIATINHMQAHFGFSRYVIVQLVLCP